ncbi:MAG: hypothetical protein CM15mP21_2590 [Hyphomicrobiales bacterium]|nr:MAG: hypothetical protein CM15mP21_2590 [Hyphomicrobiales bacterium]
MKTSLMTVPCLTALQSRVGKRLTKSDMTLMPDPTSARLDPFYAQQTLSLFCNILEPNSGESYNRDPRSTALRAEEYLKSTGIGDTVYLDLKLIFVFDDVRFSSDPYNTGFALDSTELPDNSGTEYEAAIWVTARAPKAAISGQSCRQRSGLAQRNARRDERNGP